MGPQVGALIVALACALTSLTASAEPRLPKPHHGKISFVNRWSASNATFQNSFGSATTPARDESETQLERSGVYGLSRNWAIEFNFSATQANKWRHGSMQTVTGFDDQEIGIERALQQKQTFADAAALNVVVPTGSMSSALSTGVVAVQPGYEMEIRGSGFHDPYLRMNVEMRFYSGGLGSQWRTEAELGERVTRYIDAEALMSYYRGIGNVAHGSEAYDELRMGVELKGRLSANVLPFIRYERDFAGRNVRSATRMSFGVELRRP